MRRKKTPDRHDENDIANLIGTLPSLSLKELRAAWKKHLHSEPPPIRSREFVIRLLAWELQANATGGLTSAIEKQLLSAHSLKNAHANRSRKTTRKLCVGVVLIREWKGIPHTVKVTTAGFEYSGTQYKSLSVIARQITGTRWSGPRFFGLDEKTKKKGQRAAA